MGLLDRLMGRPLDRDGFGQRVRAALAGAGVAAASEMVYDPLTFSIRLPSAGGEAPGMQGTLYLGTLYAEYLRSPRNRRDATFKAVVSMALEGHDASLSSEEARAQLRVQLRPRAFAEAYAPIRRVVADWLDLCVCLDRPTSMRYVVPSDLEAWGLDEESALQIGRAGLERDTASQGGLEREPTGVYRSAWHDTYDAARAALAWLIRTVPATGGHAIGIPNRNTLLVADLADDAAVLELTALVEREADDPRRVSYRVLTLDGDSLVPLKSRARSPAIAMRLRKLERLDLADQYLMQKERLEQDLQIRGEDVFVGSASVVSKASREPISYAVWTEGVDTLLPETDVLALVDDGGGRPRMFPYSRVAELLGHLMESSPEHGFPPRWRVRHFPTDDEIAALGEPVDL